MDNEYDQSKVAYETGPKEKNIKRRMPNSEEQTGKGSKMPQDSEEPATKGYVKKAVKHHEKMMHPHQRHKEHR